MEQLGMALPESRGANKCCVGNLTRWVNSQWWTQVQILATLAYEFA